MPVCRGELIVAPHILARQICGGHNYCHAPYGAVRLFSISALAPSPVINPAEAAVRDGGFVHGQRGQLLWL